MPKTNIGYWGPKLERNRARDAKHLAELDANGWKALIIWECEIARTGDLTKQLMRFLREDNRTA